MSWGMYPQFRPAPAPQQVTIEDARRSTEELVGIIHDVAIGQRATKARYGAACSKSKVVLTSFQLGIRPTGNGDSAIFVGKQARSFTYLELLHYLLTVRTSGSSEKHLKSRTGITPYNVIKAGSVGHGTAVPGEFDLDLVIYTGDIEAASIARYRDPYRPWLNKIKEFLSLCEGVVLDPEDPMRPLGHAIHFNYKGIIDVDLLVSPYWSKVEDYYQFLQTVDGSRRFSFSVGASYWQVDFYSHQPNDVKEYARRAKAWRNKKWPKEIGRNGKPKSYFLSMLVLRAYEKAVQSRQPRRDYQTTLELKNLVRNHHSLDIYWENYYTLASYQSIIPSCPRIIDPANPSNNLYQTGIGKYYPNSKASDYEEGDGDWTLLVRYIDSIDLTKSVEELLRE